MAEYRRCFISVVVAAILLRTCASFGATFPGKDWQEVRPESQGVNSEKLAAAVAYLKNNSGPDGIEELVIIRNGYMIFKGSDIDKVHGVWSLTKSFTSTVLGLLIDEGKARLDTSAKDYVPSMAATYPTVTLRHFTTMTSGYYAVGDEPRGGYKHGPSPTPFQPAKTPLFAPPGSKYAYWDSAMNQFANVLTRIANEPIEELFKRKIADPIGMNREKWDWGDFGKVDGIVVNGGSGNNNKHIFICARELARFGHLFLNRGSYKGKQLVSKDWVDAATKSHVPASLPLHELSGADGRGVYGFNWWTNGIKPNGQRRWPGAPVGTYAASGYNNNDMFIIPEWKIVIVRLGLDQRESRITDAIYSTFLEKVGQAIKDVSLEDESKKPRQVDSVTAGRAWPTYRFDVTRSGATDETVGPELFLLWKYLPRHAPNLAWPMPAEEMPRMHCDNAYHVALADGNVYFASSVTNKVYAIDVASGKIRWTFFTQGPVRFSPTVADNRVYVGSDDGCVYCLDAANGELIWRYRAGPSNEKVIGNGRMISLWPVRTAVLVDAGVAYFTAGIFPFEGIYVCAVDAEDGALLWRNDTVGDHVHELQFGGISPHGYLVASEDVLYVPSGRAMPAAFNRGTGEFLFYASPGAKRGGAWALLDKDRLIAGVDITGDNSPDIPHKVAYDAKTGQAKGDVFGWFGAIDMVLTRRDAYVLTQRGVYAINRAAYSEALRRTNELASERRKLAKALQELRKRLKDADEATGKDLNRQIDATTGEIGKLTAEEKRLKDSSYRWHYPRAGLCSLILAGNVLFAGGEGAVFAIGGQTGKELCKHDVAGKAVGLAAAGHLVVSCDKGPIYCFGPKDVSRPKEIKAMDNPLVYAKSGPTELYRSAAERIVNETSVAKGYCLVLDCGEGRLAYELAKRTRLQIIGIENDPDKRKTARRHLEAAGLLGSRVVVEPWNISDLPDYFANLIVSDGMLVSGKTAAPEREIKRVLRPYGGVAYLPEKQGNDMLWKKWTRGKLDGAGSWTHLYAKEQNTACSDDRLLKGPFGVLWFGEPGPQGMVERHARSAGPLSIDGRLFIQGKEVIMAYDAYNGTFLWKREIPGAVRVRVDVDGGNLALTQDGLYVAADDKCYRLDPATGQITRKYAVPVREEGTRCRWGYFACAGDILFGTAARPLATEYAAIWKDFARTGKWKDVEETPGQIRQVLHSNASLKRLYNEAKSRYPKPDEDAQRAFQRSGANWHFIHSFPSWDSQRSAKDALNERLMGGDAVFAIEADTGKTLWIHDGQGIANISVTVADDTIFFVESGATGEQRETALAEKRRLIGTGTYEEGAEAKLQADEADVRVVVALDAATGQPRWKKPLDLTGCGGNKMGTAYADGLLLSFGHFSNHDTRFFKEGELTWRRITALDAKTGEVVWSRPLNYLRRPLIVGEKVIIEPRACDLRTGRIITRSHPITGKSVPWRFLRPGHSCGITSASADTLFYRSYFCAIYELARDKGLSLFGAIRPGCWLNMIAANGLMLMPEASSGCTCAFPLRCSLALTSKPRKAAGNWTVFITDGAMTPVKHWAINFGAPGDMKDAHGTVWFGYPRPKTVSNIGYGSYEVTFDLQEEVVEGMGAFCHDYRLKDTKNTDRPWLFASGFRGLLRCELPLIEPEAGQNSMAYRVRLGFKTWCGDQPGERVFDLKLQDRVVLENFDVAEVTDASNKPLVKEFSNIEVTDTLVFEFVPKTGISAGQGLKVDVDHAPIINFIEVMQE